jgi:hypothetical protein
MDRRTFVKRTCLGSAGLLLGGVSDLAADGVVLPTPPPIDVHEPLDAKPSPLRMPGLYPGRVIELFDSRSIVNNRVSQPVISVMLERGMKELTGETSSTAAWAKFVTPADIVGIKINPSGAPACCSSPEIIKEIIKGLESAGVPTRNIVVFDRYAYEMDIGSYQTHLPPGIGVVGIQESKLDASGYDANVYCQASFFGEWETRSYLASLVTEKLTKIINVSDWRDVLRGTPALEGGLEHHGWHATGLARGTADASTAVYLFRGSAAGGNGPCGDGYDRVAGDREEKAAGRGAFAVGARSKEHHHGRPRVLPRSCEESFLSAAWAYRCGGKAWTRRFRSQTD